MNRFARALEAKYQAEIEEALAIIELYLNQAVGVGEHPDIISVLDEAVNKLDNAKSKLSTLSALLTPAPSEETKQ